MSHDHYRGDLEGVFLVFAGADGWRHGRDAVCEVSNHRADPEEGAENTLERALSFGMRNVPIWLASSIHNAILRTKVSGLAV